MNDKPPSTPVTGESSATEMTTPGRKAGHDGPHRAEVEWGDSADRPSPLTAHYNTDNSDNVE